jgi:hypothetical protein
MKYVKDVGKPKQHNIGGGSLDEALALWHLRHVKRVR